MVKIDGELAMAVLPASLRIDVESFKREAGVRSVKLATEDEFHYRWPECEIDTMPPIGNLYGLEVFVDEVLSRQQRNHVQCMVSSCTGSDAVGRFRKAHET